MEYSALGTIEACQYEHWQTLKKSEKKKPSLGIQVVKWRGQVVEGDTGMRLISDWTTGKVQK